MAPNYSPMRLLGVPEPINPPAFLLEVKHDGFRALAKRTSVLVSCMSMTSWEVLNPAC
jgi:hypothetical protein